MKGGVEGCWRKAAVEGGRKGMKGYGETERDGVMRRGSKEGGRERLVLFPKRAACDAAGQERYRRSEDGDAPSVKIGRAHV